MIYLVSTYIVITPKQTSWYPTMDLFHLKQSTHRIYGIKDSHPSHPDRGSENRRLGAYFN